MRTGIHYETGFRPSGVTTRSTFDPASVADDMHVIAHELGCDVVRISGGDLDRLVLAATAAAAVGLEVWLSPMPVDLSPDEMTDLFDLAAERAEVLRRQSARDVVLVIGCEVTVFGRGFLPGDTSYDRMAQLSAPTPELFASYPRVVASLNQFLAAAVARCRTRFGGPITYAAGVWEDVDWRPFDIVSVDAYRDADNAASFREALRARVALGRPVAVTEFGCCTYRGAADRGGSGWAVGDEWDSLVRDEHEQVRYLHDLTLIFGEEGIDTAFWFTFASWDKAGDRDLASYGVVKVIDDQGHWEPKAVFDSLAAAARGVRPSG